MSINLEELTSRKTEETYPNLVIVLDAANQTVPVVVKTLEEGDMQLIIEFDGRRKCVARISKSAINIHRLLRTTSGLHLNYGNGSMVEIKDVETYLSCVV